jgi:8-oxo-dGTP pyrophosphatase MutT (NUDIX family)
LIRHFCVANFVVHDGKVLLLLHRKLNTWLPPGGHIDENELPDDAAVREVREEAGIECELFGERGVPVTEPRQLVRPYGVHSVEISPGHEHIDLIYFSTVKAGCPTVPSLSDESSRIGWFSPEEWQRLNLKEDVRLWAERAVAAKRTAEGG